MPEVINKTVQLQTSGRGLYEISAAVENCLPNVSSGLCHLFIHHTSASLLITENADRDVLGDLERFFARLVPDGDALFQHVAEGPDDMSAHIRSALTQTSLSIPFQRGKLQLGTWQGIYLWEHRMASHRRTVTVSILS